MAGIWSDAAATSSQADDAEGGYKLADSAFPRGRYGTGNGYGVAGT